MSDFSLGSKYRDTATGYVGTATARNEELGGTVNIKLERLDGNGKVESMWFYESRLTQEPPPEKPVGFRFGKS